MDGHETDPSRERAQPLAEVVPVQRALLTVQLHSGVLSHQAARKLDRAGWRLDERDLTTAAAEPTAKAGILKRPTAAAHVPAGACMDDFRAKRKRVKKGECIHDAYMGRDQRY